MRRELYMWLRIKWLKCLYYYYIFLLNLCMVKPSVLSTKCIKLLAKLKWKFGGCKAFRHFVKLNCSLVVVASKLPVVLIGRIGTGGWIQQNAWTDFTCQLRLSLMERISQRPQPSLMQGTVVAVSIGVAIKGNFAFI